MRASVLGVAGPRASVCGCWDKWHLSLRRRVAYIGMVAHDRHGDRVWGALGPGFLPFLARETAEREEALLGQS